MKAASILKSEYKICLLIFILINLFISQSIGQVNNENTYYWSDITYWQNGQFPNENTNVIIPQGHTVMLDMDVNVRTLIINGKLIADRNKDLELMANYILVEGGSAELDFGKENSRYTEKAIITLKGNRTNGPSHPNMGKKFLGAHMGGKIYMHGNEQISWTKLAENTNNSRIIKVAESVNWKMNDSILITSSSLNHFEAETFIIRSISTDGTEIELNRSPTYEHKSFQKTYSKNGRTWNADLRAEVGLLTHNITIQGDPSSTNSKFGGHIMLHSNAEGYFDGVELYNMGQESLVARYPFHWHLLGDRGSGQYFKNSSVHKSYNRAITIHGTNSVLVDNNLFYDHIGHGVFLEDGSERFNTITKNVTLLTRRPVKGKEVTPSDNQFEDVQNLTPASYWITNPQNTFEDNIAAGSEGTGFWFAFPEKPMGASADDPRFSNLKPNTLPLISFKRNTAHSCGSAFDIFDGLTSGKDGVPDHTILRNRGWLNNDMHYIEDCTWYANKNGLYTGIGRGGKTNNLIFKNNILVENRRGIMFASNSVIDGSIIVGISDGKFINNGMRYAYRIYDGPGQIKNSHFVKWNVQGKTNFFEPLGGATKHPNHIFENNTTHDDQPVRFEFPDYDLPPKPNVGENDNEHPRRWSIVINDNNGGLGGNFNSNFSIIGNHPFQRSSGDYSFPYWQNAFVSNKSFVLSRLVHNGQKPNIVCTREKDGTDPVSVYYNDGYKENHQLPIIANDGYEYTYQFEELPVSKKFKMVIDDATVGDYFIVKFKDFGTLQGLNIESSQSQFIRHTSLQSLRGSSPISGYYIQNEGDLYIKVVAKSKKQNFKFNWSSNLGFPNKIDTDGDFMADGVEISNHRHPFDASDLEADFENNSDLQGWDVSFNLNGVQVNNGVLKARSVGNGDAQIRNESYDFNAQNVGAIEVKIKALQGFEGPVLLFFQTDGDTSYSTERMVHDRYENNGAFQVLRFETSGNQFWQGKIKKIRLDPVSGANINFEIDYIRAVSTNRNSNKNGSTSIEESKVILFPNPVENELNVVFKEKGFEKIRISDLNGEIVMQKEIIDNQTNLKYYLSDYDLKSGIYIVQLIGIKESFSTYIIKIEN